jgi:hypothetical protein
VASFLGRHRKKQCVLPALVVVHATRAGQLPVNARRAVMALFAFRQTHGAIMPLKDFASKDARAATCSASAQ